MSRRHSWRAHYFPERNKRRLPVVSRVGVPTVGFVLSSVRPGLRTHAPLVFALEDLWTYAFGGRAACFTLGRPWYLQLGKPTCRRCQVMLRNFGL